MTERPETAAPALKEIFNRERIKHIGREILTVEPHFRFPAFLDLATENLDDLSIMQRMRQVAYALSETLPYDFEHRCNVIETVAPRINHRFAAIALCEFVGGYGRKHFDRSMQALRYLTKFGSAEFSIRQFIMSDPKRTLAVMKRWAKDKDEHVRRLASEGCRPRLPWSFQLDWLILDPSPVLPILETLKGDPSLYVRKSVANHLNDITKDHPERVLELVAGWDRDHAHTRWIVRQGLRTLVKKGDRRALALLGAGEQAAVTVTRFDVTPGTIQLGDRIRIDAGIASASTGSQRLVIDYAVHYMKKSGTVSRKVFKWKEVDLPSGASTDMLISQTIRDFTTRKHFPGHHRIELMVNGDVLATTGFTLNL